MKSANILLTILISLGLLSYATLTSASNIEKSSKSCQWQSSDIQMPDWMEAPPINPTGSELIPVKIAEGTYALMADRSPVDNSGFIVGEKGVLVIDAHINGEMAQKIQGAIRNVTDKPILYLVNTNYHGDHTFGNYAFPAETKIIAHKLTAEKMLDFEEEKRFLLKPLDCDERVLEDVKLRLPDIQFETSMTINLGDRDVEIHHLGAGNTEGDTIIYDPKTRTAWTGNMVSGEPSVPWLILGEAQLYMDALDRLSQLNIERIIPSHGSQTEASKIESYIEYLNELVTDVETELKKGRSLDETVRNMPLSRELLPEGTPEAFKELFRDIHRWNITQTYEKMQLTAY